MTDEVKPIEVKVTASALQTSVIDNNEVPDALYEAIENLRTKSWEMSPGSGNKTISLVIENDLQPEDEEDEDDESNENND